MTLSARRTTASAAFVLLMALAAPVSAQDKAPAAADPGTVVAKVGSEVITEGDLALAQQDFGQQLAQVPAERRHGLLVDVLVDMHLLAAAGREQGIQNSDDFKHQVDFLTTRALRNAYVKKNVVDSVSPEELKAEYDKQVATFKPQEEVHARHILVDTKEQAEKIIADLKGGAAFEELAKQSKDGSGQNGGDLGFFTRGQMVPAFETAAFALKDGEVTQEPVQSQFGWHVIKVEEKRMSAPPPQADVEDQLRNAIMRSKFETLMASLRQKYPVEVVGGDKGGGAVPDVAAPDAGGATTDEPETDQPADAAPATTQP